MQNGFVLPFLNRSIVFSNTISVRILSYEIELVPKSGVFHHEQILESGVKIIPRRDHPVRLRLPPLHGRGIFYSNILHSSRLRDVGWQYHCGWLLPGIGMPGAVLPSLPGLGGAFTSFSRHWHAGLEYFIPPGLATNSSKASFYRLKTTLRKM